MTPVAPGAAGTAPAAAAPMDLRGLSAAIAAISVSGFAISMAYPLFAVLLEGMGASGWQIGVNAAAPALAMLVFAPLLPALLRRVSLPMVLCGAAVLMAAAFLLFKPFEGIWTWTLLRFFMGAAGVAAFWGSELWIVSVSPPARRGLMIGIYGLFLSLGFVAGPVLLQFIDITGWAPFLIGAGLSLAAILPVAWAWARAPRNLGGPRQPISGALRFFRTDPSVMFGVVLFGAMEFGAFALLPAWALGAGLGQSAAIATVAWIAFGNVLLQLPLGWAADRWNRKAMLAAAAAACVAGPGLMALTVDLPWALAAVMTALGGLAVALYTVGLAELGARYQGEELARGTGAFMFGYGLGAFAAPPFLGLAMDLAPPHGLLGGMAALACAYLALMALRAGRRRVGSA